jgi:hypothetical protein
MTFNETNEQNDVQKITVCLKFCLILIFNFINISQYSNPLSSVWVTHLKKSSD